MFSDRCIQLTPSLRTCSSSQVDRYSSHDVSLILSHLSSGELQRCAVCVRAQTADSTIGSTSSTHASVIHWNPASILDHLYVLPIATGHGQWQEATKTGKEEGGTGQYLIKMLAQISSPARRHIRTHPSVLLQHGHTTLNLFRTGTQDEAKIDLLSESIYSR